MINIKSKNSLPATDVKLKSAHIFFYFSWMLFLISASLMGGIDILVFVFPLKQLSPYLMYGFWIQVLIMLLLSVAIFEWLRKYRHLNKVTAHLYKFPRWLLIVGLITLIAIILHVPMMMNMIQSGQTISGEIIHSKHWYEQNGKFFIEINKNNIHEISETQFNELNIQMLRFFLQFWLVMSYVSLIVWDRFRHKCTNEGKLKRQENS